MTTPDVASFDQWYRDIDASDRWDPFWQHRLGLPPGLRSSGYLTGSGLAEVLGRLHLHPGDTLVELGCGRGGYGLAAVRDAGARLVGVDFSAVALAAARRGAAELGLQDVAAFQLGDLAASGLPPGSADVLLCVDAFHFAETTAAAAQECRRLLRPGGRLAVTCWQPLEPGDPGLPERLRNVDVGRDLAAAGLVDVDVRLRPDWSAVEQALWSAASALHPAGDPAVAGLVEEAQELLPLADALQRVLVTARGSALP